MSLKEIVLLQCNRCHSITPYINDAFHADRGWWRNEKGDDICPNHERR